MKPVLFFCFLFNLSAYSQRLNFNYSYSMFNESMGHDLITTSDGHYLFAGSTFYHNGPQQAVLYKLDMNGNVIWSQLSSVMAGEVYPGWVIETRSHLYLTAENFSYIGSLIKMYDSSGNVLWTRQINRSESNFISAVELSNNIYCFGTFMDTASQRISFMLKTNDAGDSLLYVEGLNYKPGNYKTSYCVTNNNIAFCSSQRDSATGNYPPSITLIDTNAVELWTRVYNLGNAQFGKSLIVNNAGDFYFNTSNNTDLFKTDPSGNFLWRKFQVTFHNNTEIVNWNNNDVIIASPDCIAKYDSSGTLTDSLNISLLTQFSAVAFTDSTFAFVGSKSWGNGGAIYWDSFVMQYSDTSFVLNISESDGNEFKIYPVPFQSYLKVHTNSQSINKIRIFDSKGRVVFNQIIHGDLQIYTGHMEDGVYFLEIENNNSVIKRNKILKMDLN